MTELAQLHVSQHDVTLGGAENIFFKHSLENIGLRIGCRKVWGKEEEKVNKRNAELSFDIGI